MTPEDLDHGASGSRIQNKSLVYSPIASGMCTSLIKARSLANARSDDSNSCRACCRFVIAFAFALVSFSSFGDGGDGNGGESGLCEPEGLTGTDFDMVPFIMADVEGCTMSAAELISSRSCVIDIMDSLCQRQLRAKQRSSVWGTHLDASAGKSSAVSIGVCPE